ncbi:hypothetical protein DPMN_000698 [Dreissena polymorpha]|uniref:Uncharacterized protein n=1 Tax=Dreissena polymorpha TaxID=45954 RepID=A0A9D4MFV7_DREPO|nr:hypothetical protein DPMN_000698 [Dreissena polymorpha]
MRRQLHNGECELGGRRKKHAPRRRPRETLVSSSINGLQGRNSETKLIDAKHQTSIGTCNVRKLWKNESLELLIDHLNKWFRWDVIGLSEMRRT